jgi:integrase
MSYETLSQAVALYDQYIKAQGLAANTRKNKIQTLNHAKRLWGNPVIRRIQHKDISEYFTAHPEWAPKTRNLYLGGLREFFAFCRNTNIAPLDFDPTRGWRSVREPSSTRFWLPPAEFPGLLDAAIHPRDRMIIAVGLFAVLRGSETRILAFGDVDLTKSKLHVYVTKTKREMELPIVYELAEEFERYFEWVKHTQGPIQPSWVLTPTRHIGTFTGPGGQHVPSIGMKMTTQFQNIYMPVRDTFKRLGYDMPGKTGNHALRRSGARMLLDFFRQVEGEQSAVLRVSNMLGHKNLKDTLNYIGLDIESDQLHAKLAGTRVLARVEDRKLKAV